MKKFCLMLFLTITISGCNLDEVQAISDNINDEKVWVFAQFNVPFKEGEIEDYYYYAKISQSLYTRIKNNSIKQGFILMDDVMYWGDDGLIHEFSDLEHEGEIIFRIEDIRKISLVNKKPIAGQGSEQFESKESAETSPEEQLKTAPTDD